MPGPEPVDSVLPLVLEEVVFEAGGRRLLHGVTFRLEAGPVSVILGPNGSGKSLTLRLCEGLLTPTAGRVRWLGPGAHHAAHARAWIIRDSSGLPSAQATCSSMAAVSPETNAI